MNSLNDQEIIVKKYFHLPKTTPNVSNQMHKANVSQQAMRDWAVRPSAHSEVGEFEMSKLIPDRKYC